MKGRKHEGPKPNRKRGGGLTSPKVEDAGGNPNVKDEAKKVKSIGKIGGIKSAFRGDRKHGGRAHRADGGPAEGGENPAERKRGGRMHREGREHESHEGAEERKRGGGVHHASGGAAGGADTNPYSSAGRQLRRKGGHCA